MRIYKNREFRKWAVREGLSDHALMMVVDEMERGLVGVNLGGQVYKKRVEELNQAVKAGLLFEVTRDE